MKGSEKDFFHFFFSHARAYCDTIIRSVVLRFPSSSTNAVLAVVRTFVKHSCFVLALFTVRA